MELDPPRVHQTHKDQRLPAPAQHRTVAPVVSRSRTRSTAALEQRRTWGERGQGPSAPGSQQPAEVADLKAAVPTSPASAERNAPVVPAVRLRRERACPAVFRLPPGPGRRDSGRSPLAGPGAL